MTHHHIPSWQRDKEREGLAGGVHVARLEHWNREKEITPGQLTRMQFAFYCPMGSFAAVTSLFPILTLCLKSGHKDIDHTRWYGYTNINYLFFATS